LLFLILMLNYIIISCHVSQVPNYIAVILSVTLVLIFGEILPSALFTGPNQLLTAAFMTKFVYFLLALFYPIAFPISKLLDCIFGDEVTDGNISRSELEALVIIQGTEYKRANSLGFESHGHNNQPSRSFISKSTENIVQTPVATSSSSRHPCPSPTGSGLSDVEVNLMTGILKLSRQIVEDAMIKISDVYMMSSSMRLNHSTLCSVLDRGFSRIPIFKRRDRLCHLGYLLVKELAVVTPSDEVMIETLTLRKPLFVRPSLPLLELLRLFQEGRCHLAMVTLDPALAASGFQNEKRQEGRATILGIVTLEDVLEKVQIYIVYAILFM